MILLVNTRITSQSLNRYPRAPWLPVYSRFDIFKYCLASYSAMLPVISKAVFYIALDEEFAPRREELENYITDLFPDALIRWEQNRRQADWRRTYEADIADIDDDQIWVACNDDHIFVDYNLDVLKAGLKLLRKDPNPKATIYYSHFPEQMNMQWYQNAQLSDCGNYVSSAWCNHDSVEIMSKERYRRYWYDAEFPELECYRTDALYQVYTDFNPQYSPTREMCRHYDAYSHVGCPHNISAPLFIPPGFGTGNMHIRYGYKDRIESATNIDPTNPNHYAALDTGTDYRLALTDLPLFWHTLGQIGQIDIAPGIDTEVLNLARDNAYLNMTHAPLGCWGIGFDANPRAPQSWFKNHFRSEAFKA